MNPQDPLAALHPLREPVAIGWWPPAPGWWLLAGLVLAALLALAWYALRRYRANAYRRQALARPQPACTVGSLCERSRAEALLTWVQNLLNSECPGEQLAQLAHTVKELFPLSLSGKHMSSRDLGRLAPTPALSYRAAAVCL